MTLVQTAPKKILLGDYQSTLYSNYLPQAMLSNTQDGYTASGSTQLGGNENHWCAFFVSTQGGTDHPWHSQEIGAGNWVYTQIQMPNKIIVDRLEIGARKNESSSNLRPIRAFVLKGSNDGTNRTEIKSVSGLGSSWSIGSVQTWNITGQTIAYEYLKLEVQANSTYVAFDYWNVGGTVEVQKEIKRITIRPNGTEKQIRPAAPKIEEYVMLSEGGAENRFSELSVDGSYQSVFNNTTNWYTAVTKTDKFNQSHKIFSDKEIVGFDLIYQYANPSLHSCIQFSLTTADKSKGFGSPDGQDSYIGWYGVRFELDGVATYVSGSVTTDDVQIVGEKNGNTWTVNRSGGVTFSQTFTVDYIIQRVSCGAWMWFTGTTGYIKKLVLYLKDL